MSATNPEAPQSDSTANDKSEASEPSADSGRKFETPDQGDRDEQAQLAETTDDDKLEETPKAAFSATEAIDSLAGIPTSARYVTIHATNFIGGRAAVGSVAGRDNVGRSENRLAVSRGVVTTERLERIRRVFVPPPAFPDIRRCIASRSLLLLQAPQGWGRTTAALRALHEEGSTGMYTLEPDLELRTLELEFTRNTGYLMESFGPDQVVCLRRFHLEQLSGRLREHGCAMIVLLDGDATPPPDLGEFLLDTEDRADPRAVVGNHLRERLDHDPAEHLSHPDVAALLAEYAQDPPDTETLAQLGDELADVAEERAVLQNVLARHRGAISADFEHWFDGLSNMDARAFTIALAVFNGMPSYLVTDAARALARDIAAVEDPDRIPARQVFGSRNSELVTAARAQWGRDFETTLHGEILVETIEFRDRKYPPKVLDLVWREYHAAHEPVREWLLTLGRSSDFRVCARAGAAAGLLSVLEFDHMRTAVIEPWARSGIRYDRIAATTALQFAFLYSELALLISRMLDTWLHRDQPLALRITAARVLGTGIGEANPESAVARLRRAARSSRTSLRLAVSFSMAQLFWADRLAERILGELLRWTEPAARPRLRDTGLRSVLDLSRYRHVRTTDGLEDWPVVVCLTGSARAAAVTLFGRLLHSPDFPPEAYAEIRQWVGLAEKDPNLREPLARFLFDLGITVQDNEIVPYYLRAWAAEPRGPQRAVQEILATMDSMGRLDAAALDSKGTMQ